MRGRNRRRRRRGFPVRLTTALPAGLLSSGGSKALARNGLHNLLFSCLQVDPKANCLFLPSPRRDNVYVQQIECRGHLDLNELGGSQDKHVTVGHRLL